LTEKYIAIYLNFPREVYQIREKIKMCYNISNSNRDAVKIQKALGLPYSDQFGIIKLKFTASGFTHPEWPVITADKPNEFQFYQWGLIPKWTPNAELAKQFRTNNLNAKSETIFEKRSFNRPIKSQRCLIPVTGFFEWRDVNKKKYPYHIHLKHEEIFCLGGIYDEWVNRDTGEIFNTFAIVTTEANPLMAKIHNLKQRMPLILAKQNTKDWLIPNLQETDIKALMKPLDESLMTAYTISKRITSRKENPDAPETLQPFIYPELAPIDI